MKINFLQIKRALRAALFVLLMVVGLTKTMAQTPYRQYANDGVLLNFHEIDNVDFRLFLLYNLSQDDRFAIIVDDTPGLFSIISDDENNTGFYDTFEAFYQNAYTDFSLLSKTEILDLFPSWKSNTSPSHFSSAMMDIALRNTSTINNHCIDSESICSLDGIQFQAANTSQTADQLEGTTLEDGCIGSSYNPSWFNMEIGTPGQFIIHMEGHDPNTSTSRDIDFCIWGPFYDPTAPCVSQLTTDKIVDCSYSSSYTEDIFLGYQSETHIHNSSHGTVNYHMPETGEYYILMITNYSREPCVISFSKTVGSGPGNVGCGGQKIITAVVNPEEGGTVTGAGEYEYGSSCTLTATANDGYVFMDWADANGVVVSTDAEYTFTVRGYRTLTANFVEDNACFLTFNLNDFNGDGWSGNYLVLNFEDGSTQKLTVPYDMSVSSYALPIVNGSHISLGWNLGTYPDQCSFTVNYSNGNVIYHGDNLNDSFNFEFDVDCDEMPVSTFNVSVDVNLSQGGVIIGAGQYDYYTTCTLIATANAGYAFANWTQDGTIISTDAEYTFIVMNDVSFVANFVSAGNIVFADSNVKSICVAHWDTNGDGELSYVEAANVTDLSNYFQGNTEIMMFNELQYFIGLSSIGANAFQNCSNLMLMTLPNNITSIGNYAFYNCSGLIGGLTIPNSVITIGNYAFAGCSGFMGILTIGNSVTTIGNYAFNGCRNFTGSLNIPNSVTTIGDYAFNGCTAFWGTLTIGNSVTTIGNSAFYGCTGLVGDIVIPNSITSIGSNAFYDCHSFGGTLTLGNSVTTIGSSAFYNCYGLTGSLSIPNSVTTIGNSAFYNCYGFTGALIIGNSVTSIGSSAFYNCYGFAGTLTLGNSVTTIGSSAFYNCDSFTGNLDIPNSVTSIGSSAFYDCNGFVGGSLTIPSSVTSIGGDAFYYCTGFSEIYYNVTNHTDISEGYYNYPFRSCGGHLNIGNNVVRIAANMFRNANFTGILTIPNSVVAINDNAFNNCWHLTGTLVIPNSINTIGISAFQNCDGLSEIIMGNNVLVVGNTAFYSCSGLLKVTLPHPVTVIGIEAFRYCTQLSEINMQSMQAPSIGWDVFSDNATGRVINIPCGATENYSAGYWTEWTDALNEMCNGLEIIVEVNPLEAGNATGGGTYNYSEMCTLAATSNLGYPFLNWTKNGVVVSTEATYSFGVTESCTYVANFSDAPVSYAVIVTANSDDGGTVEGSGNYLYGATATLTAIANQGYHFLNWTENGEEISVDNTLSFVVTSDREIVANFEVIIEVQTLEFTQGWNWFSPNIEITLDDLKTALVEALPGTAISIKSQTQNISYNPNSNRWSGSLVWNVAKMYMIKVAGTCEIELEGMPINPADHPVAISSGANWLAFPLNSSMSLNNAFAGFALSGDKVRSQTNNALYNGIRWQGQLNTLEPGKGYIYISNSSDDRIFTFPTNTK